MAKSIIEDLKALDAAAKDKGATKEPEGSPAPSEADQATNAAEGDDSMAKAPAWGGFKIETGVVPSRATAAGRSKYDWASFPAPSNPEDSSTWPSVFIPDLGGKTIYTSIKKYRDKLQKDGVKDIPEFTVSVSKDPKGVRVIRKK